MNKERRKEIDRASTLIAEALEIITNVKEQEEEAFDNLPESMQEGDRGQKMQECIDALDTIDTALQEAEAHIDAARGEG